MSNDNLLRSLGRLSARQAEDDERPLPPELTAPAPAATRQHLANQALAALAPDQVAEADRSPGLRSWVQRLYARRTLLLMTPALGAAAMGLMFARGGGEAPLPAYTMQLSGGVASVRGEASPAQQPAATDRGQPGRAAVAPRAPHRRRRCGRAAALGARRPAGALERNDRDVSAGRGPRGGHGAQAIRRG